MENDRVLMKFAEDFYKKAMVDIQDRYLYEMELKNVFEELIDLSNKSVVPFTRDVTYIIRKSYGILDDGKYQTQGQIGDILHVSASRIGVIVRTAQKELFEKIYQDVHCKEEEKTEISSLEISDKYDRFKNETLEILNISNKELIKFKRFNVYTIRDLLTHSKLEYKLLIDANNYNKIVDRIHELGLKFIEDLNHEEKRKLINNSSSYKILNSSSQWLNLTTLSPKDMSYLYSKYPKIRDVVKLAEDEKCPDEIISELSILNIKMDIKKILLKNFNNQLDNNDGPIEELPNKKITKTLLSKKIRTILKTNNINTVKDLINCEVNDLFKFEGLKIVEVKEIVDYVHQLGLPFKDEYKTLKYYNQIIHEKLRDYTKLLLK